MAGQSRYIHSVDEEVKNDYWERTYAKDVQSTVGGIDKGEARPPAVSPKTAPR